MAVVVETLLPHLIGAVAVNNKILENCFAFVFAGKVVFLALVDQVVFAFVVKALVPSVSTSAWFARKLSCFGLAFIMNYASVVVAC